MKYFDDHMLSFYGNHQTPYGDKVKGLPDKYQLQDWIVPHRSNSGGNKSITLCTHL
ncbi:MAG: hypothetical protein IPI90_15685 [Saprospiraceae bacterium]|nr:hypothetical protein [Candidatus Vicinibacter affinis]